MSEKTLKDITTDELRSLIRESIKETLNDELEDIIALLSPEYLKSIEEARADYREGRITPMDEILE